MSNHFTDKRMHRPYILVYEDQSEAEELGMMNLNNVRVDYKKDLEGLLQVRF